MTPIEATLTSALSENQSHKDRIIKARDYLAPLFPMSVEGLESLKDEEMAHLDQFLFRFSKMQDSLGTRLIPALYDLLEGQGRVIPFLDVLHGLEKLRILTSVASWQKFRVLRNSLAHDYPETREQTVVALNMLYQDMEEFLSLFAGLEQVVVQRLGR